jgi:hypothetical protein
VKHRFRPLSAVAVPVYAVFAVFAAGVTIVRTVARWPAPTRPLVHRGVLAGISLGRRASGVNAHPGAGHEHRLMAIVPTHNIRWLTAHALDLEHFTTTGGIADVQAMHRDPITDRCLHQRPLLARHPG